MSAQTDRELLELAAKAAGVRYDGYDEDAGCDIWFVPELARYAEWNPLTDDGDALRLAVKLNLCVGCFDGLGHACASTADLCRDVYFREEPDHCAATRRAIVRAAAAIGERMFSTAAHVRQEPSPADPGVGGELLRTEG